MPPRDFALLELIMSYTSNLSNLWVIEKENRSLKKKNVVQAAKQNFVL